MDSSLRKPLLKIPGKRMRNPAIRITATAMGSLAGLFVRRVSFALEKFLHDRFLRLELFVTAASNPGSKHASDFKTSSHLSLGKRFLIHVRGARERKATQLTEGSSFHDVELDRNQGFGHRRSYHVI